MNISNPNTRDLVMSMTYKKAEELGLEVFSMMKNQISSEDDRSLEHVGFIDIAASEKVGRLTIRDTGAYIIEIIQSDSEELYYYQSSTISQIETLDNVINSFFNHLL
jgi:hypothetical protein